MPLPSMQTAAADRRLCVCDHPAASHDADGVCLHSDADHGPRGYRCDCVEFWTMHDEENFPVMTAGT